MWAERTWIPELDAITTTRLEQPARRATAVDKGVGGGRRAAAAAGRQRREELGAAAAEPAPHPADVHHRVVVDISIIARGRPPMVMRAQNEAFVVVGQSLKIL